MGKFINNVVLIDLLVSCTEIIVCFIILCFSWVSYIIFF